jgi:hypothetical protein
LHVKAVFLQQPALARATHGGHVLPVLLLETKLVSVCAVAKAGATTRTATAGTVRKTRWQLHRLPRIIAEN